MAEFDWKQLAGALPSIIPMLQGNGPGMAAFMDGYNRTRSQLTQQQRLTANDAADEQQRTFQNERVTRNDRLNAMGELSSLIPGMAEAQADAPPQYVPGFISPDTLWPDKAVERSIGSAAEAAGYPELSDTLKGQVAPAMTKAQRAKRAQRMKDIDDAIARSIRVNKSEDAISIPDSLVPVPFSDGHVETKPYSEWKAELGIAEGAPAPQKPSSMTPEEAFYSETDPNKRKLMLDDREAWAGAGRKPESQGGGGGMSDYQNALFTERLAKSWQDATKTTREMERQYRLMQIGLKQFSKGTKPDKIGGSQAVLVTFQKILDPTSVVRESEYARSASGLALMSRMEGYVERLKAGGAGVPREELAAMVDTAREFLDAMKDSANQQRSRLDAVIKRRGLAPEEVFGVEAMPMPSGSAGTVNALPQPTNAAPTHDSMARPIKK